MENNSNALFYSTVESLVDMLKNPGRQFICLNGIYDYDEVRKEGLLSFVEKHLPSSNVVLYKYFPNIVKDGHNYSREAFINNQVYLADPITFDDSNDSEFYIDREKFKLLRIRRIAKDMGLSGDEMTYPICREWIANHYSKISNDIRLSKADEQLVRDFCKDIPEFSKIYGIHGAIDYLLDQWYLIISRASKSRYKASCFTTRPINKRMWDQYADHSRGFCL